jgi:hypothetical protein
MVGIVIVPILIGTIFEVVINFPEKRKTGIARARIGLGCGPETDPIVPGYAGGFPRLGSGRRRGVSIESQEVLLTLSLVISTPPNIVEPSPLVKKKMRIVAQAFN